MNGKPQIELPFGSPLPARPLREELDVLERQDPSAPRTIEMGIPMRDGVELAADVHLPAASDLPAPAIVIGTPYDKSTPRGGLDGRSYRDAGYAVVCYDVRGRGKSEGIWRAFVNDGADGHDVVEWVATQDWCTGAVGVAGLSYAGWVVWATMAEHPAHLCGAVSTSAAGRWMEEIPYTHGCYWLYFAFWFARVRRRIMDTSRDVAALVQMLPIDAIGEDLQCAGPSWREFLEHDTLDDFWQSLRWDGSYDFDVPCLHVTGWHDREDIQGAFHHYEQMMATSPARDRQWLLVGPWSHGSSRWPTDVYSNQHYPGASLDMTSIHLRFFDHALRNEPNGFDQEARIWLYDPGRARWEVRAGWNADTGESRMFLGNGEALDPEPTADGEVRYRYDPLDPAGVRFDVKGRWEPPLELNDLESQPGVVRWTGDPLPRDVTVHGWVSLELWASTDGDDTDWHVKLADVDPEGQSLCVSWGCLRASYGSDPKRPCPVTPGEPARYAIELTPTFHTFLAGHRMRVVVASAEWPWFARSLNRFGPIGPQSIARTATNIVYFGSTHQSCLRLPIEA
jgi:putative CocE/NonD family hydrolase